MKNEYVILFHIGRNVKLATIDLQLDMKAIFQFIILSSSSNRVPSKIRYVSKPLVAQKSIYC